nr:TPA_asm: movement protein [Caladenia ophiovirus]
MLTRSVSQSTEIPLSTRHRVSFSNATEHLREGGVHTLVSLSSDCCLTEDVECMVSEFASVTRGEIESVISPLSLKLKEGKGSQKIVLTNLQKISSMLKKMSGNEYPFYRIDKVKILYIPLFDESLNEGEKMRFSLCDTSIISERDRSISTVEVSMNKMSMSELSMSYFVRRKDLHFIELDYHAGSVPVRNRSYAFMMVAFYIHRDFFSGTLKRKNSLTLEIDALDRPMDINTTSSVQSLCDQVTSRLNLKKKEKEKEKRRAVYLYELEKLKEKVAICDEGTSGVDKSESSIDHDLVTITPSEIGNYLPRNLPIMFKDSIVLDTAAPNHWVYNPNLLPDETCKVEEGSKMCGNPPKFTRIIGDFELKLGCHWVNLKNVLYGSSADLPLISYTQLVQDGIINCLQSISPDRSILLKDDKLMFELRHTEHGRMIFESVNHTSERVLGK